MEDNTYCFDVQRLGFESLSKSSTNISSIQKPLKKLYISYQKAISKAPHLSHVRLNGNKRGLSVASILYNSEDKNFTFMSEALITDNQVIFRGAFQFLSLSTEKKNPKYKGAFVNLDPELKTKNKKEYNSMFVNLDEKENFLAEVNHPPLFICVNKAKASKNLELRVFVCDTDEQALDIMKALKGEIITDCTTKSYNKNSEKDSQESDNKNNYICAKISNGSESNNSLSNVVSQQTNQTSHPSTPQPQSPETETNQQIYNQQPYPPQPMHQAPYPNQSYNFNPQYQYPPYGTADPQLQQQQHHAYMKNYQQQPNYFTQTQQQPNQYNYHPQPATQENGDSMSMVNMKLPRPTIDQSLLQSKAPHDISNNINQNNNDNLIEKQLNSQPNHDDIGANIENKEKDKILLSSQVSQMPALPNIVVDKVPEQIVVNPSNLYPDLSPQVQPPSPPQSESTISLASLQKEPSPERSVVPEVSEVVPTKRIPPAIPSKKPTGPPTLPKLAAKKSFNLEEMGSPTMITDGKESLHLIKPRKLMGIPVLLFPGNMQLPSKKNNVEKNVKRLSLKEKEIKEDIDNSEGSEVEQGLG